MLILWCVLDSGVPAMMGYAAESKIDFEFGIIRNHYVAETSLNLLIMLEILV